DADGVREGRADLRHKAVSGAAIEGGLESTRRRRQVAVRRAGQIDVAFWIKRNRLRYGPGPAEGRRIEQLRHGSAGDARLDFGEEGCALQVRREGRGHGPRREARAGGRPARDVSIARRVNRNPEALFAVCLPVAVIPAEEARIEEGRAVSVELRDEGLAVGLRRVEGVAQRERLG